MASVTVALTGTIVISTLVRWSDSVSLGSVFSLDGNEQILRFVDVTPIGLMRVEISTNNDFTDAFEATGRIIVTASDGMTLEVMIANADIDEPYFWTPTNSAEVTAFYTHIVGLTDRDATLTLTDDQPPPAVAPAFTNPSGAAQSWTQNTTIQSITVPAATGTPTPTYAVVGTLPAGLAFNTTTRVISGTPTASGSGTIRIRATNTAGTADWTVAYTTAPPTVAPNFADDTGDAQSWTAETAIIPITVPAATGNPTPTYAVVGTLPAGLAFNTTTRVITGTPTASGSGTIRIRATNTAGTADWTVAYTTAPPIVTSTGGVSIGDLTLVGVSIGDVAVDVLLGDILLLSSGVVVPSGPTAPWDFATSFADGYAVDFIGTFPIASADNANRLFEVVPPRGTLNRAHPSGMFVDNSIYAIERIHRFTDVMILIHNGGQSFPLSQQGFIPFLSDDYTWYIIQLNAAGDALADPVYWKAWRANSGIVGIGGGFVRYDVAQSGYVHRGGTTAQFGAFLSALQADRAMIALLPDPSWAVGG